MFWTDHDQYIRKSLCIFFLKKTAKRQNLLLPNGARKFVVIFLSNYYSGKILSKSKKKYLRKLIMLKTKKYQI